MDTAVSPPPAVADLRVLIISPVRNEGAHIERVAEAMQAQSRTPDLWLVCDDASEDDTATILAKLAPEIPFMQVVSNANQPATTRDRLALALEAQAFNRALRHVDWHNFDLIGKLDGDIELPAQYFERLLADFNENERLGITGGSIVEQAAPGAEWKAVRVPDYHVHGALKLYSRKCFEAVGGIQERLGWDTIDETYARMFGFDTVHRRDLVARHLRPSASADGLMRGRARHGECAYIVRYSLPWVILRALRMAWLSEPRLFGGIFFLGGYLSAVAKRAPKVEDDEFRRFVRRELRGRMLAFVRTKRLG